MNKIGRFQILSEFKLKLKLIYYLKMYFVFSVLKKINEYGFNKFHFIGNVLLKLPLFSNGECNEHYKYGHFGFCLLLLRLMNYGQQCKFLE